MVQFSTKRLLLRDFTQDDFTHVYAFDSDPELSRYRGGGKASEEDTRAFIQRTQQWLHEDPRPIYAFAILHKEQAQMIGVIGLTITKSVLSDAELWYRLSRQYWNQGLTTEAAAFMLSFGFMDLHLHRIAAMCHPDNIGSWKVMEKIGMRNEGYLRQNVSCGEGVWRDTSLYAIIEDDWRANHEYSTTS